MSLIVINSRQISPSLILTGQENLNESMVIVNKSLQSINKSNMDIEMVSQMWDNYAKNTHFNMEATGQKKDPI